MDDDGRQPAVNASLDAQNRTRIDAKTPIPTPRTPALARTPSTPSGQNPPPKRPASGLIPARRPDTRQLTSVTVLNGLIDNKQFVLAIAKLTSNTRKRRMRRAMPENGTAGKMNANASTRMQNGDECGKTKTKTNKTGEHA